MGIVENVKNFSEHAKNIRNGRRLEKLNKNIELMNLREIANELVARLIKINKNNEFDSRDEELINYVLYVSSKDIDKQLFFILGNLNSQDLKLQFLEKFGDKFSRAALDDILKDTEKYSTTLFTRDKKAERESRINRVKIKINDLTSNLGRKKAKDNALSLFEYYKNPFLLRIKHDEANRARREQIVAKENIVAELFVKNYNRLNIHNFVNGITWSTVEKIYVKLPKEIQGPFIIEFLNSKNNFISNGECDKVEQALLDMIPIDTLKFEIIKSGDSFLQGNKKRVFSQLNEKIGLSFSDIQNYYRKTGHLPITDIKSKLKSADEIIEELKYFKVDGEKERFVFYTYRNISSEELKKLLESNGLKDELKILIYQRVLYQKEPAEQIEICNKIISLSKDDKEKNDFRIYIASLNDQYDEVFKILKSGEYRNVAYTILLKFSDEQIRELYDTTENYELRKQLLSLPHDERQKDSYLILINKDNYASFFKNAKSYLEIHELLTNSNFEDFRLQMDFDQILELYKDFCQKELKFVNNDKSPQKWAIECFKSWLLKDLNIEKIIKLTDTDIEKEELQYIIKNMYQDGLTTEDAGKYILDALKIQDIDLKSLILDKINEINYYGMASQSGSKSNAENLEKIYQQLLESDEINIANKYVLLSSYIKLAINGNCVDEKIVDKLKKIELQFKKLNEIAGKPEYSEIFDLSPQYKYSEVLDRNIITTDYYNSSNCIKYLNSDLVYNKLVELYKQNHSINQYLSSSMLKDVVIQILDDEVIEFISRYRVDTSSFGKIFEDQNKTIIFIKAYDRLKVTKTYSEEDAMKLAEFINKLDSKNIREPQDNIDLILAVALNKELRDEFLNVKGYINEDKDENIFEKFIERLKQETREEIHSPILTKMQGLDAIGKRFFGLHYRAMEDLVNKFSPDLDIMLRKYQDKSKSSELTLEEKNELHSLKILRNLKELLSIQDKKAMIETYDELDKLEEFQNIDFSLSYALEENLRRVYAKDYKENIYTINSEDKIDEVDGVEVYSPKQFNMLVHVVAAFGDFKLIDKEHPEISAKEMWKNIDNKQNHILCTSLISEYNLCFAKTKEFEKDDKEPKVIFGFSNFGKNSVLMAAPYDLGSVTTSIDSDQSYYSSSFRCAKNMLDETRVNHNEVCIERRLENQKDNNIVPDYIVCIDDITDEAKKIATDFGIPIILLNTNQIAKNESEKLEGLFKEFYEKKDPSKISEILTLYQTNYYSYIDYKTELAEKYFNPIKMNEEMKKMLQWIDREYKIGDKEKAIQCYNTLSNSLGKEIDLLLKNVTDPEETTKGQFKIRELNYELKQRCKKVNQENNNKNKKEEDSKQNGKERELKIIREIKEVNSDDGRA